MGTPFFREESKNNAFKRNDRIKEIMDLEGNHQHLIKPSGERLTGTLQKRARLAIQTHRPNSALQGDRQTFCSISGLCSRKDTASPMNFWKKN